MKVKVAEAEGAILDWMVAKCEGKVVNDAHRPYQGLIRGMWGTTKFLYSTRWAQGGPIIDRIIDDGYIIQKGGFNTGFKVMRFNDGNLECQYGPTPLIAAMRCYVASKLGDVVEVPDELGG